MPTAPAPRDLGEEVQNILSWFDLFCRDLPWRYFPESADNRTLSEVDPWGVLVSEIMLQQTPVARVEPVWRAWMHRWPTPSDLAGEPPAEVIKAWGRLGYPRRALRLHAAACAITEDHNGVVPDDEQALRALPGVGDYTAGAVLAFAFGRPALALDTNVRRVIARHDTGISQPSASVTKAERERAQEMLPDGEVGARWMAALMELGALVCTSRSPDCESCPVASSCRWRALGYPDDAPRRRTQATYTGSDRQARGALLNILRDAPGPVTRRRLEMCWPDAAQRERALDSLVADGLVEPLPRHRYRLPVAPVDA